MFADCYVIKNLQNLRDNSEFIVASTKENSYDSRYFGIVRGEQIKGVIEMIIPS